MMITKESLVVAVVAVVVVRGREKEPVVSTVTNEDGALKRWVRRPGTPIPRMRVSCERSERVRTDGG